MKLPGVRMSIVEEWKKKSHEMSSQSNDCIIALLSKGIDAMAEILNKESSETKVLKALVFLDVERRFALQRDKNKDDAVRSLLYGLIESLHFTLTEFNKERNQTKKCGEIFTQNDLDSSPLEPLVLSNDSTHNLCIKSIDGQLMVSNLIKLPKGELFDDTSIKIEDTGVDEMEIKEEEIALDDVDNHNDDGDIAGNVLNSMNTDGRALSENDEDNARGTMTDEMIGEEEKMQKSGTLIVLNNKDSETKVDKKRSLSRMISGRVKITESSDDSDDDFIPSVKKSKSDTKKVPIFAQEKKKLSPHKESVLKNQRSRVSKTNSTDLGCPKCEYRGKTTQSLTDHLRHKHSTTLALAGFAFRCDCGVEVISYNHSLTCDIANFTVIRKTEPTTPQCLLCEIYPKTASAYSQHLIAHHKSTLRTNGIYLICSCGAHVFAAGGNTKHEEECNPREFTLHKFSADNMRCVNTPLRRRNKLTLL